MKNQSHKMLSYGILSFVIATVIVMHPAGEIHAQGNNFSLPDLVVTSDDILVTPLDSETVNLSIVVHNKGDGDAQFVSVDIFNNDPKAGGDVIGDFVIPELKAQESEKLDLRTKLISNAQNIFFVIVDMKMDITELVETNNQGMVTVTVPPTKDNVINQSLSNHITYDNRSELTSLQHAFKVSADQEAWVVILQTNVFAGGVNGGSVDGAWWYEFFTKYYGYDPSHVFFLSYVPDKNSVCYPWFNNWLETGIPAFGGPTGHPEGNPVKGAPTKGNALAAFDWLRANSDENDKVIFINSSHGGSVTDNAKWDEDEEVDGIDGYLLLDEGRISDGEIAKELSSINAAEMIVILESCYSGEFIWDIEREIGPNTLLRVITCAAENDLCYTIQACGEGYYKPQYVIDLTGRLIHGLALHNKAGYIDPTGEVEPLDPTLPIEYVFEFDDYPICSYHTHTDVCPVAHVTPDSVGNFIWDCWFNCPKIQPPGGFGIQAWLNTPTDNFFFSLTEFKIEPVGPVDYTYIADEGESFTFTETVDVAYGANGQFNYMYGVTGTITFDNATFGDPIYGVVKAGFYRSAVPVGPVGYTYVADEGDSFDFTETVDVAYGANEQFNYMYGVTGTITFDNATFGDPIYGVVKAGFYRPAGPVDYTYIADEGESFTFTETVDVAYGANEQFNYMYGVTGTITFDNETFGDPIYGVVKAGFYRSAVQNPIAEIIGTWSDGISYYDVAASSRMNMTTYTTSGDIAAGDITGDGVADVASSWPGLGLYYQNGSTFGWTKISDWAPYKVAAGDVTGD